MRWRARTIVQRDGARRASRPQLKHDPLGSFTKWRHLSTWLLLTWRSWLLARPLVVGSGFEAQAFDSRQRMSVSFPRASSFV